MRDEQITRHWLLERRVLEDLRARPSDFVHNIRRRVPQVLRLSDDDRLPFLILVLHGLEESIVLRCQVVGLDLAVRVPIQLGVRYGASCPVTVLRQRLVEEQLV